MRLYERLQRPVEAAAIGVALGIAITLVGVWLKGTRSSEEVVRAEVKVEQAKRVVETLRDTITVYRDTAVAVLERYEVLSPVEPADPDVSGTLDDLVAQTREPLRTAIEGALADERAEHQRVSAAYRLRLSLADSALYAALSYGERLENLVEAQDVQIKELEGLVDAHKGEWWKRAGVSLGTYALLRGAEEIFRKP